MAHHWSFSAVKMSCKKCRQMIKCSTYETSKFTADHPIHVWCSGLSHQLEDLIMRSKYVKYSFNNPFTCYGNEPWNIVSRTPLLSPCHSQMPEPNYYICCIMLNVTYLPSGSSSRLMCCFYHLFHVWQLSNVLTHNATRGAVTHSSLLPARLAASRPGTAEGDIAGCVNVFTSRDVLRLA